MSRALTILQTLEPLIPDLIKLAPAGEPQVLLLIADKALVAFTNAQGAPAIVKAVEDLAEGLLPEVIKHLPASIAGIVSKLDALLLAIDPPDAAPAVPEVAPAE